MPKKNRFVAVEDCGVWGDYRQVVEFLQNVTT